jgi:hypothetical protein
LFPRESNFCVNTRIDGSREEGAENPSCLVESIYTGNMFPQMVVELFALQLCIYSSLFSLTSNIWHPYSLVAVNLLELYFISLFYLLILR